MDCPGVVAVAGGGMGQPMAYSKSQRGGEPWIHKDVAKLLEPGAPDARLRRKLIWTIINLSAGQPVLYKDPWKNTRQAWRRRPVEGCGRYLLYLPGADATNSWVRDEQLLFRAVVPHDPPCSKVVGRQSDFLRFYADVDFRTDSQNPDATSGRGAELKAKLISGPPGTGKTVTLLYQAREELLAGGGVLYITLSERLSRFAHDILTEMMPPDLPWQDRFRATTPDQLCESILGEQTPPGRTRFRELVNRKEGSRFRQQWPDGLDRAAEVLLRDRASAVDRESGTGSLWYEHLATTHKKALDRLVDAFDAEDFAAQRAAKRAAEAVRRGCGEEDWLGGVRAVLIDEAQDLTAAELQMALALVTRDDAPPRPRLFVAGDASQTIHPSGFDWKVFCRRLWAVGSEKCWDEVPLEVGERSQPTLVRLINATSSLYGRLPQVLRPENRGDTTALQVKAPAGQRSEVGLVARVETDLGEDDIERFLGVPGHAVVELGAKLAHVPSQHADRVLTVEGSKGLERSVVLVWGLQPHYERLALLTEKRSSRRARGVEPWQIEARLAIDELRVACSRATSAVVLALPEDASVIGALDLFSVLEDFDSIGELQERLGKPSAFGHVEMLMLEAEDNLERGQLDDAIRRAREALTSAAGLSSRDLHRRARRVFANMAACLASERWESQPSRVRDLLADLEASTGVMEAGGSDPDTDDLRRCARLIAAKEALCSGDWVSAVRVVGQVGGTSRARITEAARRIAAQAAELVKDEASTLLRELPDDEDARWDAAVDALRTLGEAAILRSLQRERTLIAFRASEHVAAERTRSSSLRAADVLKRVERYARSVDEFAWADGVAALSRRYRLVPARRGLRVSEREAVFVSAGVFLRACAVSGRAWLPVGHVRAWIDADLLGRSRDGVSGARAGLSIGLAAVTRDETERRDSLQAAVASLADAPISAAMSQTVAEAASLIGRHDVASAALEAAGLTQAAGEAARRAGDPERAVALLGRSDDSVHVAADLSRLSRECDPDHLDPAECVALARTLRRLADELEDRAASLRPDPAFAAPAAERLGRDMLGADWDAAATKRRADRAVARLVESGHIRSARSAPDVLWRQDPAVSIALASSRGDDKRRGWRAYVTRRARKALESRVVVASA